MKLCAAFLINGPSMLPLRLAARRALPLLLLAAAACAMSVVPPTFDELVAESETIVRGVVTEVRAEEFDSPRGRGVRTFITFRVERALKGAPGASITLVQLGGTAGARSLTIPGMPQFHLGDRQIVFAAQNGRVFCPLVGLGHGAYYVRTDAAGRDYVARSNGTPLTSLAEIAAPLEAPGTSALASARALGAADFEARITTAITQQALARQNR